MILSQIALSITQDYTTHIGDKVMLKCAADEDQTRYSAAVYPRQTSVLAVNVVDPNALLSKNLSGPLIASGTQVLAPNQRTVFCIEG